MSIDELIEKAMNSGGGALAPSGLFALVGDLKTNEIWVLNLEDFFTDNFRYFVLGEDVSLMLLGVYDTEQSARESIQSIREKKALSPAGLLVGSDWYVLMADTIRNNLFALPLIDYYTGYFGLFHYQAEGALGKVVLNIFSTKQGAEECAEVIRMYIKDKDGNIL